MPGNNEASVQPSAQNQEVVDRERMGIDDEVEPIIDPMLDIPDVPVDLIKQWKERHGTFFRIWFLNEQYIYRPFTYSEYMNIRKTIRAKYQNDPEGGDEAFREEIQKQCVLWPQDYAKRLLTDTNKPIPGGIPMLLADYILAGSGFTDQLVPDIFDNSNNG